MSKEVGLALTIVGAIGALIGVILVLTCTASFFGTCLQHAYSGVGLLAALGGGAMLFVGIVLLATAKSGGPGPLIPPFSPGFSPAYPAPPQGAANPVATPLCNVCGQPLAWIAQNNRWYCSRCGQYR